MGEAIASTVCSLTHTRVCQFAGVARVGASRVNHKLFAQASLKNLLAENLLCHRRTTYIAEADKEDAFFIDIAHKL
jgi:hypothetical protein